MYVYSVNVSLLKTPAIQHLRMSFSFNMFFSYNKHFREKKRKRKKKRKKRSITQIKKTGKKKERKKRTLFFFTDDSFPRKRVKATKIANVKLKKKWS